MKKYWKQVLIIFLLLVSVIWAGKGIFKYDIFSTHDLKHHVARSYDAVLTIKEGHFPLRWAGIMNYNCGIPVFNFYYPLLYYLVIIVNIFTGSILFSLKTINFLSFLVGTLFFYLWMKEETNDLWSSFAGAILYLYAPYRFLLVYVRGSPEYLSYALIPVAMYFFAKTFKSKENLKFFTNAFLAALFGGLLIISHNIVSVFLMPIILIYLIIKFLQNKNLGRFKNFTIIFAYISTFGLGAFFIFPALLEERFTKIATPIFNYFDHFPTLMQVLNSKWGYGDSAVGSQLDAMSFQLGYAHWIVLGLVLLWIIFKSTKTSFTKNIFVFTFFGLSIFFLYLVLPISIPFWQKVSILQTIQFSWRLLGICVFTISALFVFWITKIKKGVLYWIILIGIILVAFIGNRNHLLPNPIIESDLPFYLSLDKPNSSHQSLPAFVETLLPPDGSECEIKTPIVVSNNSSDKVYYMENKRGSTYGLLTVTINNKMQGDRIIFNLSYFPEIYHFKINNVNSDYVDCNGRVCLNVGGLKDGTNTIEWKIGQSNIECFFNSVSLLFLMSWLCIFIYEKKLD